MALNRAWHRRGGHCGSDLASASGSGTLTSKSDRSLPRIGMPVRSTWAHHAIATFPVMVRERPKLVLVIVGSARRDQRAMRFT
jgi:hypothetical protein